MTLNPFKRRAEERYWKHVRIQLDAVEEEKRLEEERLEDSSYFRIDWDNFPLLANHRAKDHAEWYYDNCDEVPL